MRGKSYVLPSVYLMEEWRRKQTMYQLTGTVSKIIGYEVWLKNGPMPMTDGKIIWVDFGEEECLLDFDHECSHILFGSDVVAMKMFVEEYARRLIRKLARSGNNIVSQAGFEDSLKGMIKFFVNILDDIRVNSLWGVSNPGSEKWIRIQDVDACEQRLGDARTNFLTFMMCRGVDVHVKDARSEFIALQDVVDDAVAEVKYADFMTCLAVCKKTLDRCINVLVEEMERDDTPQQLQGQSAPSPTGKGRKETAMAVGSLFSDDDSKDPMKPDPQQGQGQGNRKQKQQMKATALAWLTGMSNPQSLTDTKVDDQKDPKFVSKKRNQLAKKKVDQVMSVNPHMPDAMEELKADGRARMNKVLDKISDAFRQENKDDWLTEEAFCPIEFVDTHEPYPLELNDQEREAAAQAKAVFNKILGRKQEEREEEGELLDVEALIERQFDSTVTDVFLHEGDQLGFYAMVLLDISGSVHGAPYERLAKACAILREALDYPFATFDVWAFTSESGFGANKQGPGGTVWLHRFKEGGEASLLNDKNSTKAWGLTPLHHAIQIAARECALHPGVRRLFVLSDGAPCYVGPHGKSYPGDQLQTFVSLNVREARENRVPVYGLMVGDWVRDDVMDRMFHERRFWRRSSKGDEADKLVELVEENFREYLEEHH